MNGDKLLIGATEAAAALGIGRAHFYGLHSSGRLGPMPIRLGRRTLWNFEELKSWAAQGCPARNKWLSKRKGQTHEAEAETKKLSDNVYGVAPGINA